MPPTIDAFPHILPKELFERMCAVAETRPAQSWLNGSRRHTGLYDLDVRFRVMDKFGDYRQVLTLVTPPIEQVVTGTTARDLARLANDSMAELCRRHADRFVGFAAGLPMDDPDAAMVELDRAIGTLGALGVQIFTNSQRVATNPVGFQGPEHAPELEAFARLPKPPLEYFKQFYAGTTVGAVARTIRTSIECFGSDHVLFATDWPFGPPTEEANIPIRCMYSPSWASRRQNWTWFSAATPCGC